MSSSADDTTTSNNSTAPPAMTTTVPGGAAASGAPGATDGGNSISNSSSENQSTTTGAAAAASTSTGPVTPATILEGLRAHKEWARAVAFDSDGRILGTAGGHGAMPLDGEVDAWQRLFDKREATIASGIVYGNEQFDVHRFHPPLIYGRRGDPAAEESEGIAVCRVERTRGGGAVFCLITYTYPTLSARVVPQLREFCETQLANLA